MGDFTEAARLDPRETKAYIGLGEGVVKRGLPVAIHELNEAIRLAPKSADAFALRARARSQSVSLDELLPTRTPPSI